MIFYDGHKVYMNGLYPAIFLNGKNEHVHRLEWKKYNGEVPEGFVIHHKNENKLDWSIENLELLSRAEHVIEHKDIVRRHGVSVLARSVANKFEIEFKSIESASDYCGVTTCSIHRIFKGSQKQSKGWTFERIQKKLGE